MPVSEKVKLIDRNNQEISVRKQCALLQLNRSDLYYPHKPAVSAEDKSVMDEIDRIYTERPYYGWPRITRQLKRNGFPVNHKRVYRLMKLMGIEAIFPKRNLSRSGKNNEIFPYLLDNIVIKFPNHVWGTDITYIRLKKEWLYLTAIMDWYSRYIVAWELSDSLNDWFCCEALKRALTVAIPNIHNSDQGTQFTGDGYLGILKKYPEIAISMDHRGRAFDNIFNERLWRTMKYEEVYLKSYESPNEAYQSISDYIRFYNEERIHQSLKYQTPAEIYFSKNEERKEVKKPS